jgi:putative DNA primase/helicase
MDSITTDSVAALRRTMIDNGYVPIHIPTGQKKGAGLAYDKYIDKALANPAWCLLEGGSEATLNTAISCLGLRVLDCDCEDADLAKQIRQATESIIGQACIVRYRANSPRWAMVYRVPEREQPYSTSVGKKDRGLQILGTKQHLLVYGLHPSGAELQWENDQGPAQWAVRDLLPLSLHDVLSFLDKVCEILECTPHHRRPNESELKTDGDLPRLTMVEIKDCLEALPNEDEDYERVYLKVGYAVWYASEGDKEALDLWDDWCATSNKYNQATTAKHWEGFRRSPPHSITDGTLIHLVREALDDPYWQPPSRFGHEPDDGSINYDPNVDEGDDPNSQTATPASKDKRPGINCIKGKRHIIVDKAEELLVEAKVPIYQRSGILVTPKLEPMKDREGKMVNTMVLTPVTVDGLQTEMTRVIQWRKTKILKNKITYEFVDAPTEYVSAILAPDRNWSFPRIAGILTAPTLRPDGSLLDTPGYDEATGLYLVDTGWGKIELKDEPTKQDALASLERVHSLLSDIPFRGNLVEGADGFWYNEIYDRSKPNVSRSVAVSTLTTPVIMPLIGKPPAHICIAPEYGSGKTYTDDLAYNLLCGFNCPVTNASVSNEELTKVLDSHAIKGAPFICLDNATQSINNVRLSQILSQDLVEARMLGLSKTLVLAYDPFVAINGNNVPSDKDMVRRSVTTYLDAQIERPELRYFKIDNRKNIRENRGAFISDVLTMVRAYIVAGMPNKVRRLASFEGWSDYVASMLVWLGEANPILSIEDSKANDADRHEVEDLMNAIDLDLLERAPQRSNGAMEHDSVKGFTFKAGEFVNYIHAKQYGYFGTETVKFDLHIAILAVSKIKAGSIDAKSFGEWLKRIDGRIFSERRFRKIEKIGNTKVSNLWVFERVNAGAGAKLHNIKDLPAYKIWMKGGVTEMNPAEERAKQAAIDELDSKTRH